MLYVIVIIVYHNNVSYTCWYLKTVFVLYKNNILTLKAGNDTASNFTQESYFISYFHR